MHRVVAGCNLWAIVFLIVGLVLGLAGSPHHQAVGIFAAVFALLAQSAIFALFMGASKLLKEHVELYQLGPEHVARTNRIMLPLFGWASVTCGLLLVFAILAGLGASGEVPPLAHAVVGVLSMAVLGVAVSREVPALRQMHDVLLAMEAALPGRPVGPDAGDGAGALNDPGQVESPPPPTPYVDRRGRALFYIGSTTLVMLLGYRFIAGIVLPFSLTAIVAGASLTCLVASAILVWRPAR